MGLSVFMDRIDMIRIVLMSRTFFARDKKMRRGEEMRTGIQIRGSSTLGEERSEGRIGLGGSDPDRVLIKDLGRKSEGRIDLGGRDPERVS